MPCTCCEPPEFGDYEGMFDTEWASREADAYERNGLEARAERLIAYLLENCTGPLRVLDVGSGAGGVHHELLRRGLAESAVAVEASSAYIAAAREIGERLGQESKVQYVHGDFTAAAEVISSADAVILDRVICCYPHLGQLLGASASKAERFLALSYPRERWWVRLAFGLFNVYLKIKRKDFRTFVHPHSEVHSIAARDGLTQVHAETEGFWQITVYERAGSRSAA
ncbi:MAG: methyltransferase domain-containing protein [Caldilineaceae bacterium SB0670_bin_27]|uniref:Methyltransferase domain-containing protein n=1 Tax=Caldilineaceae bacterium SB0664_bin_27 TaxID=2605260 RepID=A0A6B0YNI2_9CHLR|nr:methyltransferase domain-containing protein [Caldilineaceae bacterium SB0664_bin_27]MYJ76764.1 methyltransferase domain-containing protein [Caldilineaceae bacterium SB0670_bin_27]